MPRYKKYSYEQTKMIPICYENQIVAGTFEYALNYIIDKKLDLSIFDKRYINDETGAPAFDPAILLKIVLLAYSRGIIRSRQIAKCCEENVVFMALSADTRPHFTTIAGFISTMEEDISVLFSEVLLMCNELNLIGKNMFAIDGCKLSSNASKEWSGTRKDFKKKKDKFEKAMRCIINKHRSCDNTDDDTSQISKEDKKRIDHFESKINKIQKWLDKNDDKKGKAGNVIKSNITDNESAKMASSQGVIQGYIGVAASDDKHQVIVNAEAFGEAQEHGLLAPMVEGIEENFKFISGEDNIFEKTKLTADNGYHSDKNIEMLLEKGIDAYLPDNLFRKRDPRFKSAIRYRLKKALKKKTAENRMFEISDFSYNKETAECVCPVGRRMLRQGKEVIINGYRAIRYKGRACDCRSCNVRKQCLKNPETLQRQVYIFDRKGKIGKETFTQKMIRKMDSATSRKIYSKRMGAIEPVFANICSTIGLDRFSLRGKKKVNIQWQLYCIVHNIGKIFRYGNLAYA